MRPYKVFHLAIFFVFTYYNSFTQSYIEPINEEASPGQIISDLPLPPPSQDGHVYINKDWRQATVIFNNSQKLTGYDIRFDLKSSNLEIKTKTGVKICPLPMVAEFHLKPSAGSSTDRYINTSKISINGEVPMGLAQVLFDDKVKLYSYKYIIVKSAPYIHALDMGMRKKQVFKKEQLYIKSDHIYMLSMKMKNNKHIFGAFYEDISQFSKDNKYKLKDPSDLVKIISYFNDRL